MFEFFVEDVPLGAVVLSFSSVVLLWVFTMRFLVLSNFLIIIFKHLFSMFSLTFQTLLLGQRSSQRNYVRLSDFEGYKLNAKDI